MRVRCLVRRYVTRSICRSAVLASVYHHLSRVQIATKAWVGKKERRGEQFVSKTKMEEAILFAISWNEPREVLGQLFLS